MIDPAKIQEYLLSIEHPLGQFKARFFAGLGFTPDRWGELQTALIQFVEANEVRASSATAFGHKYIVDGSIQGPNGRTATIRTVWVLLRGDVMPRFVTAYPGGDV